MELIQRITVFIKVLETLDESIELFEECKELFMIAPSRKNEQFFLGMRDSMVLRYKIKSKH